MTRAQLPGAKCIAWVDPSATLKEALHNLSRFAFESSQTVRQGVKAQRLPYWQVKLGNAAAASVRPNPLRAAGFARA
ncbi:hypothetical protein C84B14_12351 [Salinisphaera sp. C84B14]